MKTSKIFTRALLFVCAVFNINLALAQQQQPSKPPAPSQENNLVRKQLEGERLRQEKYNDIRNKVIEQSTKQQQSKPGMPPTQGSK